MECYESIKKTSLGGLAGQLGSYDDISEAYDIFRLQRQQCKRGNDELVVQTGAHYATPFRDAVAI